MGVRRTVDTRAASGTRSIFDAFEQRFEVTAARDRQLGRFIERLERLFRSLPGVRQLPSTRGVPMEILVCTPGEMRQGFPRFKEILREGQVV